MIATDEVQRWMNKAHRADKLVASPGEWGGTIRGRHGFTLQIRKGQTTMTLFIGYDPSLPTHETFVVELVKDLEKK